MTTLRTHSAADCRATKERRPSSRRGSGLVVCSPRCADHALARTVRLPRSAHADRSRVHNRWSLHIAPSAMYTRTCAGAAGVSPPWCAKTHLQGRYGKHARDRRRYAGERHCNHGHPTTGADADTPPFPWRQELRLLSRSANHGGAEGNTPPFPWKQELRLQSRSPNHGGLTPPALVPCSASVCRKLRLLRHTNAIAPGAAGVSPPWVTGMVSDW